MRTQKENQRRIAKAKRYNEWIYRSIKPFIGDRVLEIGCSNGKITQFLTDHKFCVSIDIDAEMVEYVKKRFDGINNIKVLQYDITDDNVLDLKKIGLDTILCLNVLGNVKEDVKAIRNIYAILEEGGTLVIWAPAIERLHGFLDRSENLFRRYNKRKLYKILEKEGFVIKKIFYMNFLGIFGWILNSKILKKSLIPMNQIIIFDWFIIITSWLEAIIHPPLGLSLVCICKK